MNEMSRNWISGCSLLALVFAGGVVHASGLNSSTIKENKNSNVPLKSLFEENALNTVSLGELRDADSVEHTETNSTDEELSEAEWLNDEYYDSDVEFFGEDDSENESNENRPADNVILNTLKKNEREQASSNIMKVANESCQQQSYLSNNEAIVISKRTGQRNSYYGNDMNSSRDNDSSLNRYQTKFDPSKILESQKAHKDLFKYIKEKNKEGIKQILVSTDALNKWNDKGQPALVMYARNGDLKKIKWLIKNFKEHLNINVKDFKGKTALFWAVDTENTKMVERLVNMKADPNIADDQGNTPLMIAAKKGYIEISKLLLALPNHFNAEKIKPLLNAYKNKQRLDRSQIIANYKQMVWVNVNAKNNNGDTALLLAFNNKNLEIMNLLLEHGAKIDSWNKDFASMLEWAVKRKEDASFDTVKRLLQFRKNFDDQPFSDPWFGRELLECAIKQEDFDKAWLLIEKGADLNGLKKEYARNALYKYLQRIYLALKSKTNVDIKDEDGETPLLSVLKDKRIRRVRYDLVKRLLESGANVNASNGRRITALHLAAQKGYAEIAELLIKHEADIDWKDRNGNTVLLSVLKSNQIREVKYDLVKLLLKSGADVNASNDRETALHLAVLQGYTKIAKLLIKHKADIDWKDKNGNTVLMSVLKSNHPLIISSIYDLVELLLESGANVNISNDRGITALHLAAREGYAEIVKLLIKHGADINWKDKNGNTVLLSVLKSNQIREVKYDLVKLLLESGADVNASNDRETALHLAVLQGYAEIAELLIKHKANVNATDKDGRTPLSFATDVKIAQLLVDHGAKVDWKTKNGRNWLVGYLSFRGKIPSEQEIRPMAEFILKKLSRDRINEPSDLGNTALHVTARYNYAKITELLINYGADIRLRNKEGMTPLMRTALYGSEKVAQVLLSVKKISLEEVIEALMIAAENGNGKIVELLLDTRGDISKDLIREALKKAEDKKRRINQYSVLRQFDNVIKVLKERISGSYSSSSDKSIRENRSKNKGKKPASTDSDSYFSSDY